MGLTNVSVSQYNSGCSWIPPTSSTDAFPAGQGEELTFALFVLPSHACWLQSLKNWVLDKALGTKTIPGPRGPIEQGEGDAYRIHSLNRKDIFTDFSLRGGLILVYQ